MPMQRYWRMYEKDVQAFVKCGCLPLASKSISEQEITNLGKLKNENERSNDHPFLSYNVRFITLGLRF